MRDRCYNLLTFMNSEKTVLFVLVMAACVFSIVYWKLATPSFLVFSDSAKFADIAKNIVLGNEYSSNFSFFNADALNLENSVSVAKWISPVIPYLISLSFKLFGISDFAVILVSVLGFVSLVVAAYLLGNKLFGKLVGVLSAIAIAFNLDFLNYASSGAAEPLFSFQIVLASYLLVLKNKWSNVIAFLILVLMYFTRSQAIIYIFALVLLYFLLNFPIKKALIFTLGFIIIGSILFITCSIQGVQGLFAVTQSLPGQSSSDALRGAMQNANFIVVIKKLLYNLYNFYKLLPQIMSPYLAGVFVLGLFVKEKTKEAKALKIAGLFMILVTFFVTAVTIPFFRYLHPVVPFVYLFAVSTIVKIVEEWQVNIKSLKIKRNVLVTAISLFLITFFVVGQTLGVTFLDSRFERRNKNIEKPPVYVQLSWKLKGLTKPDDLIVTNLDTWGSWYGERKTVWFPLKPDMLIPDEGRENLFDAIYLTSYLMDDENYYMGEEWRDIFYNPQDMYGSFIAENYLFSQEVEINAEDTYENQSARAILLVRKD